ncbi:MAG: hypothetical protein HYX69_06680 [Planctomycetia bacterium]|nr:hypothetical protein [Planctomycetia bacterium]
MAWAPSFAHAAKPDTSGSVSRAAREDAVQSIPLEKLDDDAREKIGSVLSQVSIFRRLPTQVIECDPKLYLFLVEHPDMVVNMWEVMGVSDMQLKKTSPDSFVANDNVGTSGQVEYLYRSHDTHIMYAEGSYSGPLFLQPVHGKCLLVLKTAYVRETNDKYFITCRLDTFIQLQNVGLELVARTFQPLVGKTADHNFRETAAFLALVSRSAETNHAAIQQLTAKLTKVDVEDRRQFGTLAGQLALAAAQQNRAAAASPATAPNRAAPANTASRNRKAVRSN